MTSSFAREEGPVADKPDDLEAVRKLTEVLSAFGTGDQERIIRWAREKLGLPSEVPDRAGSEKASTVAPADHRDPVRQRTSRRS